MRKTFSITVWIFGFVNNIGFLSADVIDHLKAITDEQPEIHSMRNIDCIYMINLDVRPEKFESSARPLSAYGISPFRFSAVNGWELPLETIDEVGIKYGPWMNGGNWGTCYLLEYEGEPYHEIVAIPGRTYFSHCMTRGAIGIVLSHLSVLKDAYDSGYETIWVMEDDIEIVRNPHLLSEYIDKLDQLVGKNGWDILFTDRDTKNKNGEYVPCAAFAWRPNFSTQNSCTLKQNLNADFKRIGCRYGAYSMIVRRSAMKKIIDFFTRYQIFLPYDMEFTLVPDIRLFALLDDVVSTQPCALSDNGFPYYKNNQSREE